MGGGGWRGGGTGVCVCVWGGGGTGGEGVSIGSACEGSPKQYHCGACVCVSGREGEGRGGGEEMPWEGASCISAPAFTSASSNSLASLLLGEGGERGGGAQGEGR